MPVGILCHKLRNGVLMPALGLGTWSMGTDGQDVSTVTKALDLGYRALDVASVYKNEHNIGPAVRKYRAPNPQRGISCEPTPYTEVVSDEDFIKNFDHPIGDPEEGRSIFVTTKLWVTELEEDKLNRACEAHLKNFNRYYADIFLLHWPGTMPWFKPSHTPEREKMLNNDAFRSVTWQHLEDIYNNGLTRAIGVSNYTMKHLKPLVEEILERQREGDGFATIPMYNELEASLFVSIPEDLRAYCAKHNILIGAYSPLGGNFQKDSKTGKAHVDMLVEHPIVNKIAQNHKGIKPAAIALRYLMQLGYAVLPKSSNPERQWDNLQCLTFRLSDEEMRELQELAGTFPRNCPAPDLID